TNGLDAYDSNSDDLSSAKVVLMANLSSCDPEVLYEVSYSDSYPNDMITQDVQEIQYSEQTHDTNPSAPNDLLVLSLVEQMTDHVAHLDKEIRQIKWEKLIDSKMDDLIRNRNVKLAAFQKEIDTLKETLSNNVKEKESLSKTLTVFKTESKEKESKYIDKEIILEKQNRTEEYYFVIAKGHAVIYVIDDEETLILEEENRSKMFDKQNDPISIENKIKISPVDYSKLNKIKEDFDEITEVQTVFNQMEAAVDQCSVDKNIFEIQIKQLRIDNDQLLNQIMSQEIMHIVANFMDILDVKKSCVNDCRMFKLDIKHISPRLKNNRDAHGVYIEKTIEYTDTLRGFVKHARTQYPSKPLLESACMFTKHVQELLVYVS
nr:hypothetical protein [Tanacetum cinerariifolium]